MKNVLNFIRYTIVGGILCLLPIILITILVKRANDILIIISAPLAERLPDRFLGFDFSKLLSILLFIAICFFSGLLIRASFIKKRFAKIESQLVAIIPGYRMVKSILADTLGEQDNTDLMTVLIKDGEAWRIGLLVEESKEYCTVFLPEAPKNDAGEVKIIPTSCIRKTNLHGNAAFKSLRIYGTGALDWLNKDFED